MSGREVKLAGRMVRIADDKPTFWDRVEAGRWEPGTLALLDARVGPQTTFIDLGAWVGPTTLFAAAKGARVIACEADPAALAGLTRNLEANPALAERVTVVPRAIHAQMGEVTFGARRKPGDSMSSVLLAGQAVRWSVETITPAALAARIGLDGSARTASVFVKIDIEGGEFALLPALGPLLAAPATEVLVSLHPAILAESTCASRPQLVQLLDEALAIFTGWMSRAVGDAGAADAKPEAEAILDGRQPLEWWFGKPRLQA